MKRLFFFLFFVLCLGIHAQTTDFLEEEEELSEVVVSATRANSRTPTTFTNLRALDINQRMILPEIPTAIGLTPSVVMTSENGAAIGNQSFRIRGSDASRINVTIDGVPVNDGESQTVFWVNMPDLTSSLQTMQIQRGVGASSNGAASFGASLNMQTTLPADESYGIASVAYGSFNTLKLNVATGTGRSITGWNVDMRYSLGQTDGYIDNGFVYQNSFFFTGGYSNSRQIIKLNVFHGDQTTGITGSGVPESMIAENRTYNPEGFFWSREGRHNNETDNYRQTHVHLHYVEQLNERLRINSTLFYTRGKGYYEQFRSDNYITSYKPDYNETPDRSNLIRRLWLDNHLWGANATTSYTTDKTHILIGISGNVFINWHYGTITGIEVPELAAIFDNYEFYFNSGNKTDFNVFVKATHQIAERWYAFGDIQYRKIGYIIKGIDRGDFLNLTQEHRYNFFNPKAGITFAINPYQRAYASFAIGRREPTRADLKDAIKVANGETPRPETLYNVETGYELKNEVLTLGANYFFMYYSDQLVVTGRQSDTFRSLMENVPRSYRTGLEFIFGVRPVKALQLNGNITYSQNKILDYTAFVDARERFYNPELERPGSWINLPQVVEYYGTTDIAFSPEWVGAADIIYEIISGLSVGMTAKYVGKQYFDNTSNPDRRLDGYFVNNAIAQYSRNFENYYVGFQFTVNNLWNEDYATNAFVVSRRYESTDGVRTETMNRSYFPQPFRHYMAKLTIGF